MFALPPLPPPTFSHNLTLSRAVSAGVPTPWPSVDSLRFRRHEHTFVAFIDMKKVSDSCRVEATLVRLFDFGVTGRLWHLLANFLCGTLSKVRFGGSVSSPWVDSALRKAEFFPPLSFQSAHRQSRCHSSFCHPRCFPRCL